MSQTSRPAPGTSSMLREACADLVRRLRAGEAAQAEQYLATFPALADDVESAVELIYTEFVAAEELGRRPDEAAFLRRFPQWTDALRRQFDIHRLLEGESHEATTAPAAGAAGPALPERVGAYEIVRPLGRGGMGTVFLATHVELGRLAAIKILHGAAVGKGPSAERFRAEVRTAAALGHPRIVQLYELGETADGRQFAAFEYVEGGSLRQALGGRPRPWREASELVRQLAEAVDCAHRAGVVHCDLTSANVLLARDGRPKIADFGLARLPRAADVAQAVAGAEAAEPITAEESSAALAGTPGYMAPERIERPEVATPAVDLYGLGAIYYELLTGRPPHVGATPLETLRQARDHDPPSPRELLPSISRDAATICLKCLERDPARRYADAAALADDLRRLLAGEPIAARPVGALERAWKWARRRPGLTAALATSASALAALAVGGAWYNVQLRNALDRTVTQEKQISAQAGELAARVDRQRRDLFTLQLNQAEALLERAPQQSRALLEDAELCPPELRDFAWGLMMRRASQERRTLLGHAAPVWSAVATADGTLVTAATDDTVRRWNATGDGGATSFDVMTAEAASLCLSSDGRRLAAAFADGAIRVWSYSNDGVVERVLAGHPSRVIATAFFPDGKWLASAGEEGELRLWDPAGTLVARYEVAESGEILSLAAAPDGVTLALGLTGGNVKLIRATDGGVMRELTDAGGAMVAFLDDGRLLSSNLVDGRIKLWDAAGELRRTIQADGDVLRTFAVDRHAKRLAYATAEQIVRVVDLASGDVVGEYRGHADRIGVLTFVGDGDVLASASDDRTIKLWDVPGRRLPEFVAGDDSKTLTAVFSPDGRRLATAGYDGVVRISEVPPSDAAPTSPIEPRLLAGHSGAVYAVQFLADGRRMLSASEDGSVRLWDLERGATERTWEHPDWVLDVLADRDGRHFYTACADGVVRRYAVDRDEIVSQFTAHQAAVNRLAIDRDGRLLATASRDGTIKLWSLDGDPRATLRAGQANVVTIDFSADAALLAAGYDDGLAIVWDVAEAKPQSLLRGHTHGVYGVDFSPDGKLLATASGGRWVQTTGEVKLWDVATGQVHATLPDAMAPVAFRGDGRMLAAGRDPLRRVALWPAAAYDSAAPSGR